MHEGLPDLEPPGPHHGGSDEHRGHIYVLRGPMPARPCLGYDPDFEVLSGTRVLQRGSYADPLISRGFYEVLLLSGTTHAGRCVRLMWYANDPNVTYVRHDEIFDPPPDGGEV